MRAAKAVLVLGFVVAVGCDLPTLPSWDVRVALPAVTDTVYVGEFLPAGVEVSGGTFALADRTREDSLAASTICGLCTQLNNVRIIYPAWSQSVDMEVPLPEELVSAAIADGALALRLRHNLPYALLRSEDGRTGAIQVALVRADGVVLTQTSVHGGTASLPANVDHTIALAVAGVTLEPGLRLRATFSSPGSGVVLPLRPDLSLRYAAVMTGVRVRELTVTQDGAEFRGDIQELDVDEDARTQLRERGTSARLRVQVDYPFEAPGSLTVRLAASESAAQAGQWVAERSISLRRGVNHGTLTLGEAQLDALLAGEGIFAGYGGELMPGNLTIRTDARISYRATFEADIRL